MGEQVPPWVHVAAQALLNTKVHVPEVAQQVPGWGQGLGVHVPPGAQGPAHAPARTKAQMPEAGQQVPGCGHGLGEHIPPGAQFDVHASDSTKVHVPAASQHVPGCGHGLGEHTPPAMNVLGPPPEQGAAPRVQTPLAELQQAPPWATAMDAPVKGIGPASVVFWAPHVPLLNTRRVKVWMLTS